MSNTKKDTVGTVYVLTNPAMRGLVKIGITQGDTDVRLAQLFTTDRCSTSF
jgi:T5orf172 domain